MGGGLGVTGNGTGMEELVRQSFELHTESKRKL